MICTNYGKILNIKSYLVCCRAIMISMKFLNGSVHQHLFFLVKFPHGINILSFMAKIILRRYIHWYFTIYYATANFLLYMISNVWNINIIFIIFTWYILKKNIQATSTSTPQICYLLIMNVK